MANWLDNSDIQSRIPELTMPMTRQASSPEMFRALYNLQASAPPPAQPQAQSLDEAETADSAMALGGLS